MPVSVALAGQNRHRIKCGSAAKQSGLAGYRIAASMELRWISAVKLSKMNEVMMNEPDTQQGRLLEDAQRYGIPASLFGQPGGCNDQIVGDILSGWRYDLSSVAPPARKDYEAHLAHCPHCRARQRLHRTIDIALLAIFTVSFFAFLLATAIIHREPWGQTALASLHTRHLSYALTLQTAAMAGLLLSLLMWILVAIATPAPLLIQATMQQRRLATSRHRA